MESPNRLRLTRNQTLALVAFVLGALAIPGNPYHGNVVQLNTKELATIVDTEVDHVTAEQLADWIIQGDTEYRLIDLREEAAFAEYHIPTAEHVPTSELVDYPLLRNEIIVLYSDGGIHSAQAWMLLRAQRYQGVYMLLGGLDAWTEEVLFPALPSDATPRQAADLERVAHVSKFFGGTPRTGVEAETATTAIPMPTVDASAAPVVPKRKRKKKKGC
jgi:rhodanese-related sulfurtransferase